MKTLALVSALVAGALVVRQDLPEPAKPLEQHAWLQQLVGEWTATAETTMEPGTEPVTMESTESVRSVGGLWILAEGSATYAGAPFTSLLTLGYDPAQGAFVGTWVDTMTTHLWSYRGNLDESGKILTLETEGPVFDGSPGTARYRDAIELKSADHKVLTSSVEGEDGTWTTFLRADFRRKKGE